MTRAAVSQAVRELVRDAVDSYEKLHTLAALDRAVVACDVEQLAQSTQLAPEVVRSCLHSLEECGFAQRDADGKYLASAVQPASAPVRELLELLEHDPVALARLMDQAALDRARRALHERLNSDYARTRHHGRR